MSLLKLVLAVFLVAGSMAGEPAWADRGHRGNSASRPHLIGQAHKFNHGPRVHHAPRLHHDKHVHHHPHRFHHHKHRAHVGVFVGVPLFWHFPPPAYPPVVAAAPPAYVERADDQATPPGEQPGYWYYCEDPKGYYPYVTSCPQGWRQVAPAPPTN